MRLVQIKYFMAVAETLNFTKAAEKLYVSQQIISKQVKLLEEELGFDLFIRNTKTVKLTTSGYYMYDFWSEKEKEQNEAIANAMILSTEKKHIRIGIVDTSKVVDLILPRINKMVKDFPNITCEYNLGNFKDLQQALDKNTVDIVVTLSTELPQKHPSNQSAILKELTLSIILCNTHPLYKKKKIDMQDLINETFCTFDKSFSYRGIDSILTHCRQLGFEPKEILGYTNFNELEIALQLGYGVTIGYEILFRNNNNNLKSYPIETAPGMKKSDLVVAWNKQELENIAYALIDKCKNDCK